MIDCLAWRSYLTKEIDILNSGVLKYYHKFYKKNLCSNKIIRFECLHSPLILRPPPKKGTHTHKKRTHSIKWHCLSNEINTTLSGPWSHNAPLCPYWVGTEMHVLHSYSLWMLNFCRDMANEPST